jgi:hypothetical protein
VWGLRGVWWGSKLPPARADRRESTTHVALPRVTEAWGTRDRGVVGAEEKYLVVARQGERRWSKSTRKGSSGTQKLPGGAAESGDTVTGKHKNEQQMPSPWCVIYIAACHDRQQAKAKQPM